MESTSVRGIFKKKMKNGETHFYVRFKYMSKTYPIKNFTKLFGCNTLTQTKERLEEVRVDISKGKNPFISSNNTIDELWSERVEKKKKNKEWSENTSKNYNYSYNSHIKPIIGYKRIEKVTYEDLKKITDNMGDKRGITKNTIKRMLRPMFEECKKLKMINENVVNDLDTYPEKSDKNLELRTGEKPLKIIRKIYKQIDNYKVLCKTQEKEIKNFLYLVLLTSHRQGEILKLKRENVILHEMKIISPEEITKTNEDYIFPLPKECKEYIQSIKSGLLFPTLKKGSLYEIFQRLVKMTNIEIYHGKRISIHDNRRLMLSIMITECKIDSRLSDYCLSHKQKGTIQNYLSFTYKNVEKSYKKYWKLLRNKMI